MKRNTKKCNKCSRDISLSNYKCHVDACQKPNKQKPKKIRGIDFDPNWGYKDGSRQAWNKGLTKETSLAVEKYSNTQRITDDELFIKDSKSNRKLVKARFIEKVVYECKLCGKTELHTFEWNGKLLVLHLDHINGISDDNSLDNLRLLCPDCHSQTETYCGKNNKVGYNKKNKKVSDKELLYALDHSSNIKEALDSVGLRGGGNYNRAYRLIENGHDADIG